MNDLDLSNEFSEKDYNNFEYSNKNRGIRKNYTYQLIENVKEILNKSEDYSLEKLLDGSLDKKALEKIFDKIL